MEKTASCRPFLDYINLVEEITGEIEKYCTELDKLQFFLSTCHTRRIALSDTLAIGDSRSDHPIFRKAGISIALNADKETKALATHSLDTKDLLDVLNFIKWKWYCRKTYGQDFLHKTDSFDLYRILINLEDSDELIY